MNKNKEKEIVFVIYKDDLQFMFTELIGRRLTNRELWIAKKILEYALMYDADVTFSIAINEAINH
ncbi:MAG: hypothetical protein KAW88_03975 [Candidatus Cloacimonetes bacterium]|nr:hypothetical protein [Candidatus Cloacimonadota bacterium]